MRIPYVEAWAVDRAPLDKYKPWMIALLGAMTVPRARNIVLAYTEQSTQPIVEKSAAEQRRMARRAAQT